MDANQKRWREANREYLKAWMREYYLSHKETMKARARARYALRREELKAKYRENREDILAQSRARRIADREATTACQRESYRRNKGAAYARASKRRAIQRQAAVGTDRAAYREFVDRALSARRMFCYWCKKRIRCMDRRIDHVVPLAHGGSDSVLNLCVACEPCNRAKGAKMPIEFAGQGELLLTEP